MWLYVIILLGTISLDQGVKYWIANSISLNTSREVVPGLLSLTNIRNNGAAWSILEGKLMFFYLITILAAGVIIYLFFNAGPHASKLYRIGLTLMLAGALGNFIDRLTKHYVVDMFQLDFINFPIFNVADFALTIGVAVVFIYLLFFEGKRAA